MWPTRDLIDLLDIDHPILQAPMAGESTPAMAVAVSNAGCLGGLGCSFMSLEDLQDMLVMLVRPDVDLGKRGFPDLEPEDRAFLLEAMAELPRESTDPLYDPEKYPDDHVKFLLPGLARVVPAENLRITNKVGLAYGFTIENAHVVDLASGREFFLAAVLYTNPDGVVNDGVYAYDEVAFPFWANLGEVVARTLWEQEDGGTQPGRRR